MARWLEHAQDGTTKYARSTKAASILAGGALAFTTMVMATSPAIADDAVPVSASPAAPVTGAELDGPLVRKPTPVVPEAAETVVVGLLVEHGGAATTSGGLEAGAANLGISASIAANEPGVSTITFDESTDEATAERLAADLKKIPGVTDVSLNTLFVPQVAPPGGPTTDPYFGYLHGLWDSRDNVQYAIGGKNYNAKLPAGGYSTRAPLLWTVSKGSASTVVAVLDTGSTPHPDLAGTTVPGYDLLSNPAQAGDGNGRDPDPNDEGDSAACGGNPARPSSWHGTHVAGTINAAENAYGVVGNAPAVKVQHVRVLGKCGGPMNDIADGITWASGGKVAGTTKNATPAKVINMSLGGGGKCQPFLQKAINKARKRGSVVIVAAGNSGQDARNFQPANCKNVITVGATDFLGGRTSYTNYGKAVDLSAPGGAISDWGVAEAGILSTLNEGTTGQGAANYAFYEGTSMATPAVSGIAALIVSMRPKIKAAQLEKILRQSTTKFPNAKGYGKANCAKTKVCGKGLIDARQVATKFVGKPKVKNAKVGKKAKAAATTVAPGTKLKYQWLRNGKKIKGKAGKKKVYKVKKKDLGKRLSVRVTAKRSGFANSKATSSKVKVKKGKPSVSIKLKKKSIKKKARARVTIKVNAGAATKRPTGKLRVSFGKKSKTYTLKSGRKGKLTVKLPKLKKGKYKIRVKYTPSSSLKKYLSASNSKKITLRVR